MPEFTDQQIEAAKELHHRLNNVTTAREHFAGAHEDGHHVAAAARTYLIAESLHGEAKAKVERLFAELMP